MHTTKKLLPAIVTTLIIFLSVYNPLIGYFCDSTITTSKYTISLSLAIVSFCLLLRKDEYIRINHLICIGLLITVWYIIRACISAPFSTYNLLQPISVLGLIIAFSRLRKSQQPILDMAIISICFIISIHIIMQFLGLLKTSTPNFYSGPFDNPAGAAMVLTTTLPLQIHMLVKNDKHKLPTALVILATLLAIIITKSRTCLLACCVIMWLHIGCAKKNERQLFIITSFLPLITLISLLLKKQASMEGRILIWKHIINSVNEIPLFGYGPYGLTSKLMDMQASNFNLYSFEESLLLDNIYHPFNEFIATYITNGPVYFTVIVAFVIVLFKTADKGSPYFHSMIALFISSLFSYPSRYPFLWLIFAYCLVMSKESKTVNIKQLFVFKWANIIVCFILFVITIKDVSFELKWKQIHNRKLLDHSTEHIYSKEYIDISKFWNGDPRFIYEFTSELNLEQNYHSSNRILEESEPFINDYNTTYLKGENHLALGEYTEAIFCFERCHKMCPAKIVPLYKMLLSYQVINPQKAIEVANMIINYPEKVESDIAKEIKNYSYKYLQENNKL